MLRCTGTLSLFVLLPRMDDLFYYVSFARMLKNRLGAGYGNKITQGKRERASFECPYQNTLGS